MLRAVPSRRATVAFFCQSLRSLKVAGPRTPPRALYAARAAFVPGCDHAGFFFGHGSQNVDCQSRGVGIVTGHEFDGVCISVLVNQTFLARRSSLAITSVAQDRLACRIALIISVPHGNSFLSRPPDIRR